MLFSLNCLILGPKTRFTEKVGETYTNDNSIDIPFEDFTVSDFKEQLFRKQSVKDIIQNSENMNLLKVELDLGELENTTEYENINRRMVMDPFSLFADYFNQIDKKPKKGYLHIIIQPLTLTTGNCLPTFCLSNKKFFAFFFVYTVSHLLIQTSPKNASYYCKIFAIMTIRVYL
jgi:hypothetical protein